MAPLPEFHVVVKFGAGVSSDVQGRALLAFERILQDISGERIEVFKDPMGDDQKLRVLMTPEQRNRL